ncbi:beta-ketoacyl synthase N-terminal-like domain-containing protein [Streptomyces sp. NPDC058086]|uniref:beta-ketoacyl synthase N-terminal-like domain-containing protein n=1 Tax=Streptomyces sp. NPDC058086 TaxID=3346334 RepID=UPI0036E91AFE
MRRPEAGPAEGLGHRVRAEALYSGGQLHNRWIRVFDQVPRAEVSADLQVTLGNDPAMLALRDAYKLGLTGPSLTAQSACLSSLVAVHLAVQALLTRELRVPADETHRPGVQAGDEVGEEVIAVRCR